LLAAREPTELAHDSANGIKENNIAGKYISVTVWMFSTKPVCV